GYNVWRKTGPLTPLERLAQVAGGHVTSWLHEAAAPEQCTSPGNDGLFYFVTAVSEAGLESLWSPPVDACALLSTRRPGRLSPRPPASAAGTALRPRPRPPAWP